MLTKLNALILGCIFLFVTPIMASAWTESEQSDQLIGPQTARISVPRAIVYSDENMNSPLGYITNGKLISVGNPRKRKPELVPIIVYGRLAFIEIKNIHYENESTEALNSKKGGIREHNIDLILIKTEEKLTENNSAYFSIHQFATGDETQKIVKATDDINKDTFLGFGIFLLHRQTTARLFWGAGYEYNSLVTSNLKLPIYLLNPMIGYTPLRNSLFLVDLTFSMDFSISAQFRVNNNNEESAFIFGPQLGARVVIFPSLKYHPFASLGYRSYKVLKAEELRDPNNNAIGGITKMSGANISFGFAIEI